MTTDEFNEWWKVHRTFFPSLNRYLDLIEDPEIEDMKTEVLKQWKRLFDYHGFTPEQLMHASQSMNDESKRPPYPEDHGRTVAAVACGLGYGRRAKPLPEKYADWNESDRITEEEWSDLKADPKNRWLFSRMKDD